jgi:hypothetical protein
VLRQHPLDALVAADGFLHQELPEDGVGDLRDFWQWALGHWDLDRVPARTRAPLPTRGEEPDRN